MNLILLGPPGAGKGTQSSKISKKFEIPQLSTGDILRELIKENTDLAVEVREIMSSGKLVPDSIMVDIIKERVKKSDCADGFILDGFPRTRFQAEALDVMLAELNKSLNAVIQIVVDDELLIDRITSRFTCAKCGEGYNKKFKTPSVESVCDVCGSTEFKYREDDNESSLKKRLQSYYDDTLPLIPYYDSKGIFSKVDGMRDIDDVSTDIMDILDS